MPVAYGESERLLGKVFSPARDNNLEAIVQEISPLPFSMLKPWILQIESFHNSISRRPSLRTHHGALETRGIFHFLTFSICSTKLPFPCSLVAEEKTSSSDNENSPATKGVEFQKRICDKGSMKEKRGKPVVASDNA
ncbi:hypothetical protein Peur_024511 [Populus x canadensis]